MKYINLYSFILFFTHCFNLGYCQVAISSFSPDSGPIGSTVTIVGNNFSPVASNNIVFFGPVKTNVISASTTSISVTVPVFAIHNPITVTVNGFTAYTARPFNVTSGSTLTATSFNQRTEFAADNYPSFLVLSDLDGDGLSELVVTIFTRTIFPSLRIQALLELFHFNQQ